MSSFIFISTEQIFQIFFKVFKNINKNKHGYPAEIQQRGLHICF